MQEIEMTGPAPKAWIVSIPAVLDETGRLHVTLPDGDGGWELDPDGAGWVRGGAPELRERAAEWRFDPLIMAEEPWSPEVSDLQAQVLETWRQPQVPTSATRTEVSRRADGGWSWVATLDREGVRAGTAGRTRGPWARRRANEAAERAVRRLERG